MSADPVMLARLARARQHAERRLRLGFDERRRIKQLAELEAKARNGELVTPVAVAPEARLPRSSRRLCARACVQEEVRVHLDETAAPKRAARTGASFSTLCCKRDTAIGMA